MEKEQNPSRPQPYLCVEATIPAPVRELFLEFVWELGTLGVEEIDPDGDGKLLAYFDSSRPLQVLRSRVETGLLEMGCGPGRVAFHRLRYDSSAWIERFNATFVGFEVNPTFWVHPPWDAPSGDHPVNILLEPGHGFGTGTHESTQLALGAVESCVRDCETLLDYGTGSGILAVAASRLRPGLRAVAFDIDPLAAHAASQTLQLNGLGETGLFVGEGRSIRGRFDLVAANLTAAIISQVVPDLERLTARYLVTAGFTDSEGAFVTDLLLSSGRFRERERWSRNGWSCLLVERCEE